MSAPKRQRCDKVLEALGEDAFPDMPPNMYCAERDDEQPKRKPSTKQLLTRLKKCGKRPEPKDLLLPIPIWRITYGGSSGSGKTMHAINMLISARKQFDRIMWLTTEASLGQEALEVLKEAFEDKIDFFDCSNGISFEVQNAVFGIAREVKEKGGVSVCVFDDLMHLSDFDHRWMTELFSQGRHLNLCVLELLQALFPSKESRKHRLNCQYFVLFQFNLKDEVRRLITQLESRKKMRLALLETYEEIVMGNPDDPDDKRCMIIDLCAPKNKAFPRRVRDTEWNCLVEDLWNAF
jgi:hypothetical protein